MGIEPAAATCSNEENQSSSVASRPSAIDGRVGGEVPLGESPGRPILQMRFEVVDEQERGIVTLPLAQSVHDPLGAPCGAVVGPAPDEMPVEHVRGVGEGVTVEQLSGDRSGPTPFEFLDEFAQCVLGLDGLPGLVEVVELPKPDSALSHVLLETQAVS